jgi:hypothetical protein
VDSRRRVGQEYAPPTELARLRDLYGAQAQAILTERVLLRAKIKPWVDAGTPLKRVIKRIVEWKEPGHTEMAVKPNLVDCLDASL